MLDETIDLNVINEVFGNEIHIASASSARTGKRKTLTFTPIDATYNFVYEDKQSKTTVKHKSPADAIEVYNRYTVMR